MPGPGGGGFGGGGRGGGFGGGRGGGGFGGGGRGGGFGGGFGGPHRPPHHHHHHHHGFFFWPRRYYGYGYGGGCLGGLFGMMLAPVVLVMLAVALIIGTFSSIGSSFSVVMGGGVSNYDENAFQDYANDSYAQIFGGYDAYEDNILIVFAADAEECVGYAYIGWVGDHVDSDISYMFENEYTKLGSAMSSHINAQSYKYSLDTNLASVVSALESEIVRLGYSSSSLTCTEGDNGAPSQLYNRTSLEMSSETVNNALESFTAQTGISISVVVDDIEDVFGKSIPGTAIFTVILSVGLIALAVWLVVRAVKNKNSSGDSSSSGGGSGGFGSSSGSESGGSYGSSGW